MKRLLSKLVKSDILVIFTHKGFENNCKLSDKDRSEIHRLAVSMQERNTGVIIDGMMLTPYISSYNQGVVMAGLRVANTVVLID